VSQKSGKWESGILLTRSGGSVDLTKVLGWLGKTQLQILSLLTCLVLVLAHTSTSWAVTERVLLRDERPQSRAGLVSSLRAIWTNMFMLPVSIRTICYIQFFANLGWYPILFFTSLWVGDIYKHTTPQGDMTREEWESTAERAGSQALFMQAVISLAISVAAPFFVSDSGIMPARVRASYHRLAADEHGASDDADSLETPRSDVYKRHAEVQASSTLPQRAAAALASAIKAVRSGTAFRAIALPLPGLTLIRLWCGAQVLFVACMLATFFVSSVPAAYAVIATTGLAWALSQWAPFALLGELVLVDAPTEMRQLEHLDTRETEVVFAADTDDATPGMHSRGPSRSGSRSMSRSASQTHASHARLPSHETIGADTPHPLSRIEIPGTARKQSLDLNLDLDEDPDLALSPQQDEDLELAAELDTTVVLRHSTDSDASDRELLSPDTPAPSTADKAGLILGIHNVFIVLPQFAITFVSSIVFAVMDAKAPAGADKDAPTPYPTAVAIVFRIGGLAAAAGAFLSYRLAQRWGRLGP
jgi:solute carrier family 45 protein 1/2/4